MLQGEGLDIVFCVGRLLREMERGGAGYGF